MPDHRLYKCNVCNYTSKYSSAMTIHRRIHTYGQSGYGQPERLKYSCMHDKYCTYTTNVKSNLNRHLKNVHGYHNVLPAIKALRI